MEWLTTIAVILGSILLLILFFAAFFVIFLFWKLYCSDKKQTQHAIRRNYPLVGRLRYMAEQISPEVMQYFTDGDNEGKPYSRLDFQQIVRFAKYGKSIISFGSKRDFEKSGFYIRNAFFPKQLPDMKADNSTLVKTKKYIEKKEKHENGAKAKYKELFFPKNEEFVDAEKKLGFIEKRMLSSLENTLVNILLWLKVPLVCLG